MGITSAGALKRKTGLVFGLPNSGFDTHALDLALEAGKKVLVLAAASPEFLSDPKYAGVDVGTIESVKDAIDLLKEVKGASKYDAIVLHGLFELANHYRLKECGDNQPSQPQWGTINWSVFRYIQDLAAACPVVYATVIVVEDADTKAKSLTITPGLQSLIFGILYRKVYVSLDAQGNVGVQDGPLALRFIPPLTRPPLGTKGGTVSRPAGK